MTGELADGWIACSFMPEHADVFLSEIRTGAEAVGRLIDIAKNGGTAEEMAEDLNDFMMGLSPVALSIAAGEGEDSVEPGESWDVVADILQQGVFNGIRAEQARSKWITPEVARFLGA